ncbi:hypothetical protein YASMINEVIRUS_1473 [Yasminevirus sp. GU-2018]|uniref:DUF4476 domain-containing protein n=1 Tax=Yasminevirus sp. GU-2018 TaxID=2420051 RepID=A0A5K0UB64_9VIRU|nr:hypothetical protein YASMINEVIRUS_1473 [Yasminevirus sp. GU-2018]
MFSCLTSFSFDNKRNEYVRSVANYTGPITGRDFVSALRAYSFDDGRTEFVNLVGNSLVALSTDELITALNTYSFDKGKDHLLERVSGRINVSPHDFGRINGCFSFGSKNLGKLMAKQQNSKIEVPTKRIDINVYLNTLGRMDDHEKFLALKAMAQNLLTTDLDYSKLCSHFRELSVLNQVLDLFKIDRTVYGPPELEHKSQKGTIFVNNSAMPYDGYISYKINDGILTIDGPIDNVSLSYRTSYGGMSQVSGFDARNSHINVTPHGGVSVTSRK